MTSKGATRTNSRRIKFARRFVSALLHMRNRNPRPGSLSIEGVRIQSHRIKMAAYLSMAHAVGSRRAWSRAVLFKLGSRARRQYMSRMAIRSSLGLKKKRVIRSYPPGELGGAKKLRQLVPGGKTMDICSLLEETAHYITCLATQVKVMQTLADNFYK